MVITFVIDIYTDITNGTVATARRFAEHLTKFGHTVRVVAIGVDGNNMYPVKKRFIPLVSTVSAKSNVFFGAADTEKLTEAITGADIVHLFLPWKMQRVARKIAKRLNVPVCAAFHCQPENITYNLGLSRLEFLNRIIYRRFKRTFYKHIDNIHCPSQFIANELRKNGYHAKMHVISNGIGDEFTPPADRPEIGDGMINIMMLGRNAPEKRKDLLINAINISKYRDRIQLYLPGKGPIDHKVRKWGEKLPNRPIMGYLPQEQLISTIQAMHLYVHAADVEIEAITCLEAIACGLVPVISDSPKSASSQFALDERSRFKHGNYHDLASKIDYWLDNSAERERMSEKYAKQASYFRISHSMRLTEEFYKQAIADHRTVTSHQKTANGKRMKKRIRAFNPITKALSLFVYYAIAMPVLYCINSITLGLKIRGRKNVKKLKNTGAVTVCNHVHTLDSSMAAIALWPKKTIFTTLPSNFKIPVAGALVNVLGAVPVPSTPAESSVFFYQLSKKVGAGRIVHFYPEGELINYHQELRGFKRGAFHLATISNVPIMPMVICYRQPKGLYRLYKRKPCITLRIGEPVYPNTKLLQKECMEQLQMDVTRAMNDLMREEHKSHNNVQPQPDEEYKAAIEEAESELVAEA